MVEAARSSRVIRIGTSVHHGSDELSMFFTDILLFGAGDLLFFCCAVTDLPTLDLYLPRSLALRLRGASR